MRDATLLPWKVSLSPSKTSLPLSTSSDFEVGSKVKGTVFYTDNNGAVVDVTAKSSAYLPLQEASIYKVKHMEVVGIVAGLREDFFIINENQADDSLILSLRSLLATRHI